jgi:hypothetical protein
MSLGRNDSCHCGSGKKFKACCLNARSKLSFLTKIVMLSVLGMLVVGVSLIYINARNIDFSTQTGTGQVWSPEHNHYH